VAWNPEYVIGVWCGYKSGGFGDKTVVGAKAAAPICWKVARLLYPQENGPWFVKPGEVKHVRVCTLSGLPASVDCPESEIGRFIEGRSSSKPCGLHRRNAGGEAVTISAPERRSSFRILSPENGAVFHFIEGAVDQSLVFRVDGNGDNERLWWFCDRRACGETRGCMPFVMPMGRGEHLVVAVNADGESAAVNVSVR
jgi:membrane carboxypeptidase/penicillin-binding protein PbpC